MIIVVCPYEHCIPTIVPSLAIGLLEKSDLDMVASELGTVSSKWYTLGQELLSLYHHDHLDSIRAQNLQNDQLRLREMLRDREEHYHTTWSDIVAGLRSLGDSQLAAHLETKYCSRELTTTLHAVLHSSEMEYKKRLHWRILHKAMS